METQNLWPDFPVELAKSPKAILKEQAGYLMAQTNNVLCAEVETGQNKEGNILLQFFIVAPALNNYRYKLLSIVHNILYYPLEVYSDINDFALQADNEEEFLILLRGEFSRSETIQVISSLLAQSLSE